MDFGNKIVNLSKGQKVSLSKVDPGIKKALVGLGWNASERNGVEFDLDGSAFMCNSRGVCKPEDFIFYNNLVGCNECITHMGDERVGGSGDDDEQILVNLDRIPDYIDKIAFTVTIFEADKRRQTFGEVHNAYIRIVNAETDKEILRFNLSDDFSVETAVVVAELYRKDGEWRFNAIGSGFSGGLAALCKNYGIDAE